MNNLQAWLNTKHTSTTSPTRNLYRFNSWTMSEFYEREPFMLPEEQDEDSQFFQYDKGFQITESSLHDTVLEEILLEAVTDDKPASYYLGYVLKKTYLNRRGPQWNQLREHFPRIEDHEFPAEYERDMPVVALDVLAYYRSGHYHEDMNGGIYIILDGLVYLAKKIIALAHPESISPKTALIAARLFLYRHEFFHHKMDMWTFRVEACTRTPYIHEVSRRIYNYFFLNPQAPIWNEEGLANAYAYQETLKELPKHGINKQERAILENVLLKVIQLSPPGYRTGAEFFPPSSQAAMNIHHLYHQAGDEGGFIGAGERILAEAYYNGDDSDDPYNEKPAIWSIFPHAFAGVLRSQKVNFAIDPESPLIQQK